MLFKICLAGDPQVGKTSLVRRFVLDEFGDRYLLTIGAKVTKKAVEVTLGDQIRTVDLVIWDIMGQPDLRRLLKSAYFYGAGGLLLACDVTRPNTLRGLEMWWEAVTIVTGPIPAVVLANKVDLVDETAFGAAELGRVCNTHGWPFLLTSAKTGQSVEEAFRLIARRLAEPSVEELRS